MNSASGVLTFSTADSATDTIPVTGLDGQATWDAGATPTLVLFFWSARTETADAVGGSDYHFGWGAVAGASDRGACVGFSDNGQGTSDCKYWLTDEHCVRQIGGGGAVQGALDFSSFDVDGFTLVVDQAIGGGLGGSPQNLRISWKAYDTVSADIGAFQASASTGTQVVSTAVDPTCLLLGSVAADSAPPSGFRNGCVSLGVATGPAEEWVLGVSSQFNVGTSNTAHYLFDGECAVDGNMVAGITSGRGELSSFGTGQFTINWLARNLQNHYLYVALSGADFHAGTVLTRTDTADITASGFGFSPLGLLFASAGHAENAQDTPAPHNEITMGFASSPTERVAQAAADEDNLATTECMTAIEHDAVYINPDLADGVEGLMDLKSLDSDGFTNVMDDPDPSAAIVGFLAIGDGAAGTTMSAEAGSYSLSGQTASLLRDLLFDAESGAYTLNGAQADLLRGLLISAESGSYAVTGQAATFLRDLLIDAEAGSYTLSGATADLLRDLLFSADAGAYALTGQQADLLRGLLIEAEAGSYTLTGAAADLILAAVTVLNAESGDYTLSGAAASLIEVAVTILNAEPGTYTTSGASADLLYDQLFNAEAGSYQLSGASADLLRAILLSADAGTYTLSGQPATMLRSLLMSADAGSYAVAGQAADLLRALTLDAEAGSYTLTGAAADLILAAVTVLNAEAGSYSVSGAQATFLKDLIISADAGSYTVSGQPADLLRALLMAADAGSYQTSGQSASLLRALVMAAESGQMTVSGAQADLLRSLLMDAESGDYTLAGEAATLAVLLNALDIKGPFTMFGEGPQRTMDSEGPDRTMEGEGPQRTMDGEA